MCEHVTWESLGVNLDVWTLITRPHQAGLEHLFFCTSKQMCFSSKNMVSWICIVQIWCFYKNLCLEFSVSCFNWSTFHLLTDRDYREPVRWVNWVLAIWQIKVTLMAPHTAQRNSWLVTRVLITLGHWRGLTLKILIYVLLLQDYLFLYSLWNISFHSM